jgi:hypothetical protein
MAGERNVLTPIRFGSKSDTSLVAAMGESSHSIRNVSRRRGSVHTDVLVSPPGGAHMRAITFLYWQQATRD